MSAKDRPLVGHTPGLLRRNGLCIETTDGQFVTWITNDNLTAKQLVAYADLFAAAPALVEALESLCEETDSLIVCENKPDKPPCGKCKKDARKALEAARLILSKSGTSTEGGSSRG